MAKDNDPWKKYRDREDEQDEESAAPTLKERRTAIPGQPQQSATQSAASEKLEDLFHQADVLTDQLNQIYQMFYVGVEKRPPLEKRAFLENLMIKIQNTPKPQAAQQFRWNTLNSKFSTHREKWERMLKDIESGKAPRGGR